MTPKILLLMSWIIFLMRFNVNGQKSREAESDERDRLPPPPPRPSKAASRDRAMVPLVPPTEISSTTTPTSVPTSASGPVCPCVKKPGSDSCIVYDQNFQAATVEEAIVNFPDLTMRKLGTDGSDVLQKKIISNSVMSSKGGTDGSKVESATDAPLPTTTPNPNDLCQTEECKACSNVLMPQLIANGLLNATESEAIRKKLGVSNNVTDCTKYNALHVQKTVTYSGSTKVRSRRPIKKSHSSLASTFTTETVPSTNLDYINNLTISGLSYWNLTQASVDANMEIPQRPELRLKRQLNLSINATIGGTSSTGTKAGVKIVGERFKIACIKRGEPLEKNSEWVSLCDACWVWRKLPVEYFPPYINELICDSDQKCLSGWGTCQQQFRNIDILKNLNTNGKDDWQAVTLESSNYCECAVKTGSALHNFVTA